MTAEKILMKALGPDRQDSAHWFAEAAKRAKRKFGTNEVYSETPAWLNISQDDKVAEIRIYGQITEFPWMDDEISASQIYDQLRSLDAEEVHVRINSPGGSVFEGLAMYSLLKEFSGKVVGHIDGIAASAATFPALGCDELNMCEGGQFMIHKPYTLEVGNSDEMRRTADVLDKIEAGMIALYQRKTSLPKAAIRSMVAEETWLTAEEAVGHGFVDSIAEDPDLTQEREAAPAAKISEPVQAEEDFQADEESGRKTIAQSEAARRVSLFERQLKMHN